MLAISSKRALISTTARTCFPASAASINAFIMGESPDVRYKVCLIAKTLGSAVADSKNLTTVFVNES